MRTDSARSCLGLAAQNQTYVTERVGRLLIPHLLLLLRGAPYLMRAHVTMPEACERPVVCARQVMLYPSEYYCNQTAKNNHMEYSTPLQGCLVLQFTILLIESGFDQCQTTGSSKTFDGTVFVPSFSGLAVMFLFFGKMGYSVPVKGGVIFRELLQVLYK